MVDGFVYPERRHDASVSQREGRSGPHRYLKTMLSINRVVKNVTYIFAGEIISKVLGLITAIILARYLGPENYGKYAFIVSFAFIFVVISDFGLNDLVVRDVARNHSLAKQYFASSVVIKGLLSCFSMGVLILLVFAMGYARDTVVCAVIYSSYILFFTLGNSISSIFKAFERMNYVSLITAINSILSLVFIGILVLGGGTLTMIVASKVSAVLLGTIIGYSILVKKVTSMDISVCLSELRNLVLKGFPFLTLGIIAILYYQADVIMLSKMKGDIYVGYYTPPVNDLFLGLLVIPVTISTVTFPIFSKQYIESNDALRDSINFTIKILIILGVGISAGSLVLAPRIVDFFFGAEYQHSVIVLQIVSVGISFAFARDPVGYGLTAVGKVKTLMCLNILALALLVVLNLFLIPLYAHVGAAIAFVFCILLSLPASLFFLRKEIGHLSVLRHFLKPLVAASAMCVAIHFLRRLNLVVLIVVGGALYLLVIFLIRTFDPSERLILKGLIRRKKVERAAEF
jgi:O-antigen/teichoic acid export membrane protein